LHFITLLIFKSKGFSQKTIFLLFTDLVINGICVEVVEDIKIISIDLSENAFDELSINKKKLKNSETKATFLSVWDSNRKESLRIDLWTKDMPLDEMKIFFYQILTSMSSTFKRATQDEKMSQTMLDFCDYFAEKLEIKK